MKSPQMSSYPGVSSQASLNECCNKAARSELITFSTIVSSVAETFMLHRLLYWHYGSMCAFICGHIKCQYFMNSHTEVWGLSVQRGFQQEAEWHCDLCHIHKASMISFSLPISFLVQNLLYPRAPDRYHINVNTWMDSVNFLTYNLCTNI